MYAAKIVSELLLVFTLMPSLIDDKFSADHNRLKESKYMKKYEERVGPNISIKKELVNFMPFHMMIGTQYSINSDIENIPIHQLIQAKDYVCSLSDYKARIFHKEILEDSIDT